MVGRTGYSPDQAATYPVLYFPKTSSCKHPLTVAMKSTKCSVLNTHTSHYTKDSRLKTYPPSEDLQWTHWIRMQPNHPHPGKSVVDVASRRTYTAHRAGGELTTRGLEPAKSRLARRSRCIRRRAGGGCKIHGSVLGIPPHPLVSGINQVSH